MRTSLGRVLRLTGITLLWGLALAKPVNVDIRTIEGSSTACSEYQYVTSIAEDVTLSYLVTAPKDGSPATLSAEMRYHGEAWIAIGFTGDSSGTMIGSDAIIGLPDNGTVAKYHMTATTNSGVYPRERTKQTLTDQSVTQVDGVTTMTFTKVLKEEGEVSLRAGGWNTLLWAIGSSNKLGAHPKNSAGAFWLPFLPVCVPQTEQQSARPTLAPVTDSFPHDATEDETVDMNRPVEPVQVSRYTVEQRRRFWEAHGIFGVLAWGFCAPATILVAFFRKLVGDEADVWLKVHVYLSVGTFVSTIIAFTFAVAMYNETSTSHFAHSHGAVGLVITILVALQVGASMFHPKGRKAEMADEEVAEKNTRRGLASLNVESTTYDFEMLKGAVVTGRPKGSPTKRVSAIDTTLVLRSPTSRTDESLASGMSSSKTILMDVDNAIGIIGEISPSRDSNENHITTNGCFSHRQIKYGWQIAHKLVGLYLLFMGLWQIEKGLSLYTTKFNSTSLVPVFWSILGIVAFAVLTAAVYLRIRHVTVPFI